MENSQNNSEEKFQDNRYISDLEKQTFQTGASKYSVPEGLFQGENDRLGEDDRLTIP